MKRRDEMATTMAEVTHPKVVSQTEWLAARKAFLAKEKEFTRLRDELSRQRRELPWEKVEKSYVFEGSRGQASLGDLFGSRNQLMVYHFMLGSGWEEGCKSCSYLADHFDGMAIHLAHRDVTLAAVSHAPFAEIDVFKRRMGWRFPWYSSATNDFNYDYHVSLRPEERESARADYNYEMISYPVEELPGMSVFFKDADGEIFHTYSTYARGLDILVGTYNWLDMAPKGRDEAGLKHTMAWVRHHDKYEDGYLVDADQPYTPPAVKPSKAEGSCCSGGHHE
jgi:predicted dithiol-disulfide oxidoreductase (DUF899 family)